jgi:ABC-2 type transport system permease protein
MSVDVEFVGGFGHARGTLLATTLAYVRRSAAYAIEIIRAPLFPLAYFGTMYLTYSLSGRQTIDGANLAGFLLVGMFGFEAWSASVWTSGYAVESERFEGTIGALFMTPANRLLVIAGYGLGGFIFLLPSLLVILLLGVASGAQFAISDPLAVLAAGVTMVVASLAVGFTLAGAFVLTRRANLLANVIQHPVYLLGGFVVPRDALPGWLRPFSDALPFGHVVDALRAATLSGASLGDIAGELAWALGISGLCVAIGALLMRKVEHAAKRSGQLELFG